jgi:hypothetical protein
MLRDIYTGSCGIHGVKIIGDFFESTLDNMESENNNGDGLFIDHGGPGRLLRDDDGIAVWLDTGVRHGKIAISERASCQCDG